MPAQLDTAVEELAELIKEIARLQGRGLKDDSYERLIDEMADVLNVYHQLILILYLMFPVTFDKVEEDIYDRSIYKLLRVYDKLPEEYK